MCEEEEACTTVHHFLHKHFRTISQQVMGTDLDCFHECLSGAYREVHNIDEHFLNHGHALKQGLPRIRPPDNRIQCTCKNTTNRLIQMCLQ